MREQHLAAVYAAQLALGRLGGFARGAAQAWQEFDGLLIAAIGADPHTEQARQAASSSILLQDAVQDAIRLADSIDDLLSEYRKVI